MKIVVAFDSFKGCLTATEACQAAALGCPASAQVVQVPLSDGGEGLT
ncbi:MAG: glycerate kinase, partial [Bacteroidales bacterium]|nr:glycerate kinase [Candidatus Minthousia equi]